MTVGPIVRDALSADFFDGTARGEFLIRPCDDCGQVNEPQAQQCLACGSTSLGWCPAPGGATVVSWVIAHAKPAADRTSRRTVLVVAELDEGPWWWGQVVDVDPERVGTGMRLTIDFERAGEQFEAVPVFRPA